MLTVFTKEQLLHTQACPKLLNMCLQATHKWSDSSLAIVVLDNGYLLASESVWSSEQMLITRIDAQARLHYPTLHWAKCESALIRQTLTESDAIRRERSESLSFDESNQSMAKQALIDIVMDAHRQQATDIHLRMVGREARIAYRIHGQLYRQPSRSRTSVTEAIAAALNTQSEDFREVFDERHLSGASISLVMPDSGQTMRIRTQKSPCRDGFSVTLRLQPSEQRSLPELYQLGFSPSRIDVIKRVVGQASGLFFISGPTGHGKTTTLAAINSCIPASRKIVSLEDPIEIIQPEIEQKFVSSEQDIHAFANMIKAVLREDPDLVEISETRDLQTANASISAALTGHLVASTIHATDAVGIISRLHDLGVSLEKLSQPGLFAGLLAQRLLPRLCTQCKQEHHSPQWGKHAVQSENGCKACHFTGLTGRVAVSELIIPDERASVWIKQGDWDTWKRNLAKSGWDAMAVDAMLLVRQQLVDPHHAYELVPGLETSANINLSKLTGEALCS
ncbi:MULTISPECIES: GspE/PulE family protein [Gammaproteobacteria]|uniref:GspE/PulE family protein n=1 Tax=Gammaproteobacteria TaxID=1236 RepID=UPI000DCF7908|nr:MULTISPECIES: ATPase, T2SS/T4P/T4SS family [Gammaproteobacteria]RTE86876.1 hypothetical protein DQX04_00330 [Aliidiomarina sp. B3213]TCZ93335.1 hypothetical protein EYQ95_04970 [Lysobacter sp. N42]